MKDLQKEIEKLSSGYLEEVRSIRRHLHRNPELSTVEFKTADFISAKLQEYGVSFERNIAGTGVVGMIRGKNPEKRNIALRADMDALPVTEQNLTEYISAVPGVMHACGHDVHMACLLGAARILNELRTEFEGSVKLIFQPSEETYPGGAVQMVAAGVLKNPDTLHVIGQHVINTLPAGQVGMKGGPYMASTDEIFLTVRGKGGHAATPEQVVDPVLIASHIVVALQQIVSRNANPVMPTVVSFGKITSDGRTNIIPDEVRLEGTVRTYDETWRKKVHARIAEIASGIAQSMNGSCETRVSRGYPYLLNDPPLTEKIRKLSREYLGEENVKELEARMTAEDFAYFANEVPSCFYRLGIRNDEKGIVSNLHTATFDVDESCLATGTGLMAWLAIGLLNE